MNHGWPTIQNRRYPKNYLKPARAGWQNFSVRSKLFIRLRNCTLAELLLVIKEKHGSTSREYNEVLPRYQYFSRAVGIINGGKVDHTR